MAISEDHVREALGRVRYPGFQRDIVSLGLVRELRVSGDEVRLQLAYPAGDESAAPQIEQAVRDAVLELPGVRLIDIRRAVARGSSSLPVVGTPSKPSVAASGGLASDLIPGVRHAIAVASGKGGVGKSTVAVNLAAAMARRGARVGLLDADIYGPSIPLMTGLQDQRPALDDSGRRLIPFERHGIRLMSLGFLLPERDTAVIWRGPMVMKAIEQLLRDVDWGELDVLVIDLPPGTGDAQLTLSQRVRLAGAVIVTTPQDVALADAIKGVNMFRKVGVPVLGIVENMSFFRCPHCGERSEVFGHGGGRRQAERLQAPFLGEVPLDAAIRASGDSGEPVAVASGDSPLAAGFAEIAQRILEGLGAEESAQGRQPEGGLFERFRNVWGRRAEDHG